MRSLGVNVKVEKGIADVVEVCGWLDTEANWGLRLLDGLAFSAKLFVDKQKGRKVGAIGGTSLTGAQLKGLLESPRRSSPIRRLKLLQNPRVSIRRVLVEEVFWNHHRRSSGGNDVSGKGLVATLSLGKGWLSQVLQ